MDSVISKLMETHKEPGDYTGENGLLYCGKCRTPKQMRIGVNPATGKDEPTIVPTPCRCRQEADKAAEALLAGKLAYDPETTCAHHDHGEGHSCGEHSCGH